MKYNIRQTKSFKKDVKLASKRGKDLSKLRLVICKLSSSDNPLEAEYKDHALVDSRKYKGYRECHIEPDWLLVYKKNVSDLILVLVDTGTHSDLF